MPSHYTTLHIPPSATPHQIQTSYITLHNQIETAYYHLSDPTRRSEYDRQLENISSSSVEGKEVPETPVKTQKEEREEGSPEYLGNEMGWGRIMPR
ncbi:MAG: hypothetical protein Q9209_001182 [Squamulea sp. 1 TL-2023]